MFLPFYDSLRRHGLPVSPREYLMFLDGVSRGLATFDADGFYHLARAAMVKDEAHFDRFDRAFAASFAGVVGADIEALLAALDLPADWLAKQAELFMTAEDRAALARAGGLEALIAAIKARLAEQQGRHQGGSKWVGTAGTSPFGAYGQNPEGIRIGQDTGRTGSAVKVWDRREFRDLDDRREIGTRNIKIALRRLRAWAREGAADELDLDGTIRATAEQGWLDVQTRPERRNAMRVLLFLDIGGSMDGHVRLAEELFSAARTEFRRLEHFYFHNCLYEGVWRDNSRRWDARTPTEGLLRSFDRRHRAIFVGDAAMSPYEVLEPGGANEHWNPEAGAVWLKRARDAWPASVWLNPVAEANWVHTRSVGLIREIFGGRMFPLTIEGIGRAMRALV